MSATFVRGSLDNIMGFVPGIQNENQYRDALVWYIRQGQNAYAISEAGAYNHGDGANERADVLIIRSQNTSILIEIKFFSVATVNEPALVAHDFLRLHYAPSIWFNRFVICVVKGQNARQRVMNIIDSMTGNNVGDGLDNFAIRSTNPQQVWLDKQNVANLPVDQNNDYSYIFYRKRNQPGW